MTESEPRFEAVHPSGHVLFRTARGGYLHSVTLGEAAADCDAAALAEAIVLTARVSHLRAVMEIRQDIVDAGFTPSAELPAPADLAAAEAALAAHRLG